MKLDPQEITNLKNNVTERESKTARPWLYVQQQVAYCYVIVERTYLLIQSDLFDYSSKLF